MSSAEPTHPSMIGGHAKYVQGAVSSLLGNTETGEATKLEAVREMRRASDTASQERPMQSDLLGTVEKKVGELTGCEGMEKEGNERMTGNETSDRVGGTNSS